MEKIDFSLGDPFNEEPVSGRPINASQQDGRKPRAVVLEPGETKNCSSGACRNVRAAII
jgi:hypothetical protein